MKWVVVVELVAGAAAARAVAGGVDRAGWAVPLPPGRAVTASALVVGIGSRTWPDNPAIKNSAPSAARRWSASRRRIVGQPSLGRMLRDGLPISLWGSAGMKLDKLREAVLARLSKVIDPETGVDVVRMRLVEDLTVDAEGVVHYRFRPSSPVCPLAVPLALAIHQAVAEVEGVTGQEMEVVGYVRAAELNAMLQELAK